MCSGDLTRRALLAGAACSHASLLWPPIRIIDPHVHVWKHDPAFPFAAGAHVPERDAAPETLLALMKANGVARTVIIQVIHYQYDNRYLASVLKQYPGTFQGVCRVDPLDPAAPDHLSSSPRKASAACASAPPAMRPATGSTAPSCRPCGSAANELKVPMTVLAPITRMPEVGLLLERTPNLTVVIDHMADCPVDQPAELEKLIALKRYPNLFVKISHTWSLSKQPYPWLDAQELVKRLHAAFGPERLMWATDWPIVENVSTYEKALHSGARRHEIPQRRRQELDHE